VKSQNRVGYLSLLRRYLEEESLSRKEYQELQRLEGSLSLVTGESLEIRLDYLRRFYPDVVGWCEGLGISVGDEVLLTLWRLWLPLSLRLQQKQQNFGRPFVQGILGNQGTGKTTLCVMVQRILQGLGCSCVSISLDDLYKTYAERQQLQEVDPRLVWRGPPGTHDVALGIQVLEQLRHGNRKQIAIPRFDKSAYEGAGDRCEPEIVSSVDVVLFEGWCVGMRPVDEEVFNDAPPPIDTPEDVVFAKDMNRWLQTYVPLWEQLDSLLVLYPQDYRWSEQWRQEAEQKMREQGKGGMSDAEIREFVAYFHRSLHPEIFLPPLLEEAEVVVEIDHNRAINTIRTKTNPLSVDQSGRCGY
jgi:D-glycerate 3-kinase